MGAVVPDLYPAIDLRGGHCVRLHQGDFGAETVYDDDPVRVAREFEAAGAQWIHVVDLDAARTGNREHLEQIRLIVRGVACKIEVGGGVRTADAAQELLDAGVERVVVGTAAVERPALVEEFWRAFAFGAGITLHIRSVSGKNGHHVIEASFKGVARALRDAVRIEGTSVPSTKGTL